MTNSWPVHLHLVTIHAMQSPQAVPLASACLQSYLDSRPENSGSVTITCSEFFSGTNLDVMRDSILSSIPDVVGLSLYVWNRVECCALARKLHESYPEIKIMGGGPEVTADPASVLAEAPFDFLVVGEGELTVAEVVDCLAAGDSINTVPGVARLVDGKPVVTRRPPIADLSILPSPWLA